MTNTASEKGQPELHNIIFHILKQKKDPGEVVSNNTIVTSGQEPTDTHQLFDELYAKLTEAGHTFDKLKDCLDTRSIGEVASDEINALKTYSESTANLGALDLQGYGKKYAVARAVWLNMNTNDLTKVTKESLNKQYNITAGKKLMKTSFYDAINLNRYSMFSGKTSGAKHLDEAFRGPRFEMTF